MDFADAPEDAAFRREFRAWLDANLTDDLKVEDAQDQRVSPDRESAAPVTAPWDAAATAGCATASSTVTRGGQSIRRRMHPRQQPAKYAAVNSRSVCQVSAVIDQVSYLTRFTCARCGSCTKTNR